MRNTDGKKLSLMANMGLTRVLLVPLLFMALMSLHVFANDDHHHDTSEKSGEDQIVQKFCPVQPEEEIDPDLFVDYQGQKVFLCCKMCRKKFLANPAPYLSRLPQFAALSQGDASHAENHHLQEEGHDHAADHGQPEGLSRMVRFLGRFHPLVIHFPIALVMVAALAEVMTLLSLNSFYVSARRFCISIAALAALAAVPLGWAAGAFASYPGRLAETLSTHRWLGTSAGILIIVAALLSEFAHRRNNPRLKIAFRLSLLAAVILVGMTGHFGAMLIFGWDHFSW